MGTKQVRLSEDVMEKLSKVAQPFESPSDCINRILEKHPCEKIHPEVQDHGQEDEQS